MVHGRWTDRQTGIETDVLCLVRLLSMQTQGVACVTALFISVVWKRRFIHPLFGLSSYIGGVFIFPVFVSALALYCWFDLFLSCHRIFAILVSRIALSDEYCIDTHQIQNLPYMNVTLISSPLQSVEEEELDLKIQNNKKK